MVTIKSREILIISAQERTPYLARTALILLFPYFVISLEMEDVDLSSSTLLSFHSTLLFMSLIFLLLFKHKAKRDRKITNKALPLPPGPKPWPIVGNLPELLRNKPSFRWINKLMEEMNVEIMCLQLGNVHVIPVTSPEIACEFLKKQDAIFCSRPDTMASKLMSRGYLSTAVTPLGEQWKKMRRVLASNILSPATHAWLHDKRVEEADHLVRYVYNKSMELGGVVNVRVAAQHYCGNVIRKLIFNKRFFGEGMEDGGPGAEEVEHIDALFTILDHLYSFCVSDYVPCFRGYVDVDGHEKIVRKALASIAKYHDGQIDDRIRRWADGSKKEQEDLLDVLILLKDANGNPLLSPEEVKAQVVVSDLCVCEMHPN